MRSLLTIRCVDLSCCTLAAAALALLVVTGCAAEPPADASEASASAVSTGPAFAAMPPEVLVREAVTAAQDAAEPSTELGVAVLDRTTGEIAAGAPGDEPFYTASVARVVVVDILDRRRSTGLSVSDEGVDLVRRALGPSDDDAMTALWTTFDGHGAATRVSVRLGLDATSAPEDPTRWGQMSTSARDRDLVVAFLADAPGLARDGFDQDFGLLAPEVTAAGGPGVIAK